MRPFSRSEQPFSPHTWGCTFTLANVERISNVFPTHVGVYRCAICARLLQKRFSPHTWGCTGCAPDHPTECHRFPHTRGGVPTLDEKYREAAQFSPHTWGCTVHALSFQQGDVVFPTHVGVYRDALLDVTSYLRFPHTRGGVPLLVCRSTIRL